MHIPRRRLGALPVTLLLAGALLAPGAGPAAASATVPAVSDVVGGPELGTRGVVVAPGAESPPTDLTAASWIVADLDSGQVLSAKDPHGQYAPASTLKTLTALALRPELERGRLVRPTFDDVAVDGSKVGLVEDVAYPAEELFEALMMVSGNDAANALATAVGGQRRAASLMNALARDLQAGDTNAVNPSGLDAEGQLSSAYDLALIGRAALEDRVVARWAATRSSSVSAPPGKERIETYNHNKLLANYDGALGIKNGYTSRARASFIGAAERDGRRLVVALMRAEPRVWAEAGPTARLGFEAGAVPVGVGTLVPRLSEVAPVPEAAPSAVAQLAPVG
jgi:D-alanyl-D-alanine carboxypeptidase (penicillin-binding protein 5/6)